MHPLFSAVIIIIGALLIVIIGWHTIFRKPTTEPAHVREESGIVIIKINLSITNYRSCKGLQPIILNVLNNLHSSIIMDMSEVESINSVWFLGLLVRFGYGVNKAGGKMVLVGLKQPVRRLFVDRGLDKMYPLFKDIEDAKCFLLGRNKL